MIHKLSLHFLSRKILFFLTLIVLLFVVLEIWAVNRLATFGSQINKLEKTKNALVLENQLLKNQLDQKSSLIEIEKWASQMGYGKTSQLWYLKNIGLALKH